jgi:hypothetical protein
MRESGKKTSRDGLRDAVPWMSGVHLPDPGAQIGGERFGLETEVRAIQNLAGS